MGHERLMEHFAVVAESLQRSTVQVRTRGMGAGSGVIWRPEGVIVTNAHVARGGSAQVELADGRTIIAEVTARDTEHDLAALTVDAPPTVPLRLNVLRGGKPLFLDLLLGEAAA